MRDIVQRHIPLMTLDSKTPGPIVWLTACIHGDEPGGTAIIHDVMARVRKLGLRCGAIHALPLINSMGFENVSRFINADHEDLNRCFPGDADGSMGEQIAHRLFNLIRKSQPSLVVDLHNDWIQSVPYLLLEHPSLYRNADIEARTQKIALLTESLLVQERTADSDNTRTLTAAAVAAGIPAFTIEAGGACGVVERGVQAGTAALLSALNKLDMVATSEHSECATYGDMIYQYTNLPVCRSSGLVRFSVQPGDYVEPQQVIARVYSALGSCEEVLRADHHGLVLGLSDHARVVPGSEIIAIAEKR